MAKAKPREVTEDVQPALFAIDELPDLPGLIEGAKQFVHSGKITCKNEERAAAIAQAFLETGSCLGVARRFHCSPHTVNAVLEVLTANGKLDDIKQRLSKTLGILAAVCADAAVELVVAGKCPANVLPITMGVSLDKKAMLDGDVTQRIAVEAAAPVDLEAVRAYLHGKGIAAPAIDVESSVNPQKPKEIKESV